MARLRWAALALCLATVVVAQVLWPRPPVPSPLAFESISGHRYSQLRRQAVQFVEARPTLGFQFVERHEDGAVQIHCRGVPVLWLERRSRHMLLRTSLDAEQRAPEVLQLRTLLQWQLQPLDYLEQMSAGVPEPVVMDRVQQWLAGGVPEDARCGAER
ncbi:hypothetical protein [Stenotrophomonas maltophilia]|uniref:hypothetical protein n=1 Tax=Stenotrophomonas maltophilia TaxID=40324 RepID=UPI0039C2D9E0